MESIENWLHHELKGLMPQGTDAQEKADVKLYAERLWHAGISAGYTNDQLKEACGGDIERYLLDQLHRP
ncbi:hypothetical protein [Rhizobium sp. Leaf341]|uniref:hypothetical protein n=1 Tax=Rhizobium sp. Leaf341 TaxID=1736344 RepID=UPI0012E3D1AB|nr:hypothetical protein [Rhizobium sp. Leaf341]